MFRVQGAHLEISNVKCLEKYWKKYWMQKFYGFEKDT